jgi:hypothetical protein
MASGYSWARVRSTPEVGAVLGGWPPGRATGRFSPRAGVPVLGPFGADGLSLRATARALGVPHMAVRRALAAA